MILDNFHFWLTLLTIAVVLGGLLGLCAYLILAERKIAAWVQDRKGPNRVGPWGLLQPIADGLKFLLKEQVIPKNVDKLFYLLGPTIALASALFAFAVVPFGPTTTPPELINHWPALTDAQKNEATQNAQERLGRKEPVPGTVRAMASPGEMRPNTTTEEAYLLAADEIHARDADVPSYTATAKEYEGDYQFVVASNLDIGLVFVFAVGSLNVYSVILGGWSSNNKYSMLGGLRASAQVISYEIPLGMSILGVALLSGSLNLERIIDWQMYHGWGILYHPLAALLFITAVFAECNRLPFDLSECEQELVGGYHTEYSGMKFALFFLGEYTHMITTSFLVMILFFGGWHLPFLGELSGVGGAILKLMILAGKTVVFIIFYMLIRWTLPRFRFDQLMGLAWKVLIPLAMCNLLLVIVVKHTGLPLIVLFPASIGLLIGAAYLKTLMPEPALAMSRSLRARQA